jgi:hypothetical protein
LSLAAKKKIKEALSKREEIYNGGRGILEKNRVNFQVVLLKPANPVFKAARNASFSSGLPTVTRKQSVSRPP